MQEPVSATVGMNLSTAIARRERDTQMINQTALFCFRRLPETSLLWLTSETLHCDLAMSIMLTRLLIVLYINRLKNRRHPALEGYITHCPPPVRHLRATTTGLSDYEDSDYPSVASWPGAEIYRIRQLYNKLLLRQKWSQTFIYFSPNIS